MVVLLVTPQGAGITVALVTALDIALVGLLVAVRQQVAIEVVLPLECLVALAAYVLPLVRVRQLVLGQRARVSKHL